ncbi:MAG: NUDIX domain-containing protein [Acidimicrobiia bacterium]|nr:NUDIX domain-containing protein [Acidimicrobiia bacterium]
MNTDHEAPPKPVPTAVVAIVDDDGRILLGRRSDDRTWCLPGGRLESGESFADCAWRECREELGYEVELDGVIAVLSNPETQIHRYPDGRSIQHVGVVFRGRLGPQIGDGDGEITEVDWFNPDQLPENEIMPADLPAIRHALSPTTTLLVD